MERIELCEIDASTVLALRARLAAVAEFKKGVEETVNALSTGIVTRVLAGKQIMSARISADGKSIEYEQKKEE